jgi:pyruvate kinase
MATLFTAFHLKVKAIAALTDSGSTALWMSRHNCGCPIYALTPKIPSQRKMALYRNVTPFFLEQSSDRDAVLLAAEELLVAKGPGPLGRPHRAHHRRADGQVGRHQHDEE